MTIQYSQYADQITLPRSCGALKFVPDSLLTEHVKNLKYALWAIQYQDTLNAKVEMMHRHLNHILKNYAPRDGAEMIEEMKRPLIKDQKTVAASITKLQSAVQRVLSHKGEQSFWLTRDMPGATPLEKNGMIRVAAETISHMWWVASGYKGVVLSTALRSKLYDVINGPNSRDPGKCDPQMVADYKIMEQDSLGFAGDVVRPVFALELTCGLSHHFRSR